MPHRQHHHQPLPAGDTRPQHLLLGAQLRALAALAIDLAEVLEADPGVPPAAALAGRVLAGHLLRRVRVLGDWLAQRCPPM